MMEKAGIIQFLIVVGVLGYGIWSAVRKSKREAGNASDRGGGRRPARYLGGENFPFPASAGSRMEKNMGVLGDGDYDEVSDKATVNDAAGEMADRLATASIRPDRPADSPGGADEAGENKVEVDLRTMIIYSELLKPKYLED